jgi:DNA-binding CsgD family transcriptional regulator
MSKSQQLRQREVRGIQRLVGECQELWYDVTSWRTRMLAGLCELTGAACGISGESINASSGHVVHQGAAVAWGLAPAALDLFLQFLKRWNAYSISDLALERFLQALKQPLMTAVQEQLLGTREWRCSELYNDYFRPVAFEHRLISFVQLPRAYRRCQSPAHQGLTMYRLRGGRPFGERELRIVHHFHERCSPLIGSALTAVAADPLTELSPRAGQTLMLLGAGESEKRAAGLMGVSKHTLHDYVKQLHRHFGVSHRRELLVRCRALMARAQALVHGDGHALKNAVDTLPVRARETLAFLLQGIAVPDIARRMQIRPNTVYTYVKRVYADLEVSSRAALFARCQGLDRTYQSSP